MVVVPTWFKGVRSGRFLLFLKASEHLWRVADRKAARAFEIMRMASGPKWYVTFLCGQFSCSRVESTWPPRRKQRYTASIFPMARCLHDEITQHLADSSVAIICPLDISIDYVAQANEGQPNVILYQRQRQGVFWDGWEKRGGLKEFAVACRRGGNCRGVHKRLGINFA